MVIDVQTLTMIEAVLLLASNGLGAVLALLAWSVSNVDVREARSWVPETGDSAELLRRRHNRRVVTEDARHGEAGRVWCHALIGLIGAFWLVTPQPLNPLVVWWAVAIRAVAVVLSCVLIEKSAHHLIARWRFDQPGSPSSLRAALLPALRLAWRDWRAEVPTRRTS